MRAARELSPSDFDALLDDYGRLLGDALERFGGRDLVQRGDTAIGMFETTAQAALAAIATMQAVAAHDWPHGRSVKISIGLDRAAVCDDRHAATARCEELCDAAEGGQVFLSEEAFRQLRNEDPGGLDIRDVGERLTRRSRRRVRAYELVVAP